MFKTVVVAIYCLILPELSVDINTTVNELTSLRLQGELLSVTWGKSVIVIAPTKLNARRYSWSNWYFTAILLMLTFLDFIYQPDNWVYILIVKCWVIFLRHVIDIQIYIKMIICVGFCAILHFCNIKFRCGFLKEI